MPIDYKENILNAEQELDNIIAQPVDQSDTEGRIAEERGLFAQNFGLDQRAADKQAPALDRRIDETMDAEKYKAEVDRLNKKWDTVFQAVYNATNNVRSATSYANKYMEQTTQIEASRRRQDKRRASNERIQGKRLDAGRRGAELDEQYLTPGPNYANAIASILGTAATVGTMAYMNRDTANPTATNQKFAGVNGSSSLYGQDNFTQTSFNKDGGFAGTSPVYEGRDYASYLEDYNGSRYTGSLADE